MWNHLDFWLSMIAIAAGLYYIVWGEWVKPYIRPFGTMIVSTIRSMVPADDSPQEGQQVSSVPVTSNSETGADEQTDRQTDVGPSALAAAISARKVDVIKRAMIDTLIQEGADVAIVRLVIKGDSAALGVEVAEARERLGITPPARKLTVREGTSERTITF